jgi:hypothetical protein
MTVFRSPNYPALDLRESYQRTRQLWNKERRTAVPPDVAAKAIGYSGISGPSRSAIAAMKKYGLVDSDGSLVKVSDLAVRLIMSTSDEESLPILRELALKPELFNQLYTQYGQASDDAIRSYLVAKLNFSDSGAAQAIKAYRETYSLARLDDPEYNPPRNSEGYAMETAQNNAVNSRSAATGVSGAGSLSSYASLATSQTFSWPLAPDVKAEVKITGGELKPEYFDALQQYLNLAKGFVVTFAVGDTVEFEDAYTYEIKYGRIERMYGSNSIIRTITKEEAGPNPKRFTPKPDPRIAAITNGTGVIKN